MTANWPEKETEETSREEHLFLSARRISTESDRHQFLTEQCGDDPELFVRLTELLSIDKSDPTFLEPLDGPCLPFVDFPDCAESIDRTVGSFTLEAELGAGGMGIVWLAKQERPVRRYAALKLIQPGSRSADQILRFERERQMLAAMGHPAIPKLLDAGSTLDGSPWFAMELVDGTPLTRYCQSSGLILERRLTLFADLCDAIQHIHQLGIVHRDVKPGNVLVSEVDGRPMVRLIDFGAAHWLSDNELDELARWDSVAAIGTLIYMSPEQADSNESPAPQNDVYSLGAVLYELITDSRPIDLPEWQNATLRERRRLTLQFYSVPPSVRNSRRPSRVSLETQNRATLPMSSRVPSDLDSIVRKALEPNREQRYATARDLAQDIRRFLKHECVSAHPRHARYVAGCYWQRNRLRIINTVLGIIGITALAVLAVMAQRKSQEVAKTRQEQLVAEARFASDVEHRRLNSYAAEMQIGLSARDRGLLSVARQRLSNAEQLFPDRHDSFEQALLRKHLTSESQVLESQNGYIFDIETNQQQSTLAIASGATRSRVSLLNLDGLSKNTVLSDFNNDVNTLDFSDDGELLLTGDEDGSCRIYQTHSGTEVKRFDIFQMPIAAVAFFDDERKFLATEIDWSTLEATTHVIDIKSSERIASFADHRLLALSADRTTAALSVGHSSIRFMRCPDLTDFASLKGEKREISCGCFSPNGQLFVAGTRTGKLLLWTSPDSEMKILETPLNSAARSLAFHPNGNYLAAGYSNGRIRIWDTRRGSCAAVLENSHGACWSLETLPSQNRLIAGFEDSTVRSFDWDKLVSHLRYPQNEKSLPFVDQISISDDGQSAIVVRKESWEIELVDLTGNHEAQSISCQTLSPLESAVSIPNSEAVLITDEEGRLYRLQLDDHKCEFLCETYGRKLSAPVVAANGESAALCSIDTKDSDVGIWDLESGHEVWKVPQDPGKFHEHREAPNRVQQLLDDESVLTCKGDFAFLFESPTTDSPFRKFSFRPTWIFCTRMTPDGKLLAVGREDHSISIVDPVSGKETSLLIHPDSIPITITFSPDSVLCATGAVDGSVALWHLSTGKLLSEFHELRGEVHQLAFSTDGTLLSAVAATEDRTGEIVVWDASLEQKLKK